MTFKQFIAKFIFSLILSLSLLQSNYALASEYGRDFQQGSTPSVKTELRASSHQVSLEVTGEQAMLANVQLSGAESGTVEDGQKVRLSVTPLFMPIEVSVKVNGKTIRKPIMLGMNGEYAKSIQINQNTKVEVIVNAGVSITYDANATKGGRVSFIRAVVEGDLINYAKGQTVSIEAIPDPGYKLKSILVKANSERDFRDITSDPNFVAEDIEYEVKVEFVEGQAGYTVELIKSGDQVDLANIELSGAENGVVSPDGGVHLSVTPLFMPIEVSVKVNGEIIKQPTMIGVGNDYFKNIRITKNTKIEVIVNAGISITYDAKATQGGTVNFVGATVMGDLINYARGQKVRIEATPNSGYKLQSIKVKGNSEGQFRDITSNPTFTATDIEYEVEVKFTKAQGGYKVDLIKSGDQVDLANIELTGVTDGMASEGSSVELMVKPLFMPVEISVVVDGQLVQRPRMLNLVDSYSKSIQVNQDTKIEVIVNAGVSMTFSADESPNGTVEFVGATIMGDLINYARGEEVRINAEPNPGYSLQSIKIKGNSESNFRDITSNPTFTATDIEYEVKVQFGQAEVKHQVNLKKRGNQVELASIELNGVENGKVQDGESVSLKVSPTFMPIEISVKVNGQLIQKPVMFSVGEAYSEMFPISKDTEIEVIVNAGVSITFDPKQSPNGKVSFEGATVMGDLINYARGEEVRINAVPNSGYKLESIQVKANNEGQFRDITANPKFKATDIEYEVKVKFVEATVKKRISLPKNVQNGAVEFVGYPDGAEVPVGTKVKLKVTPAKGYNLERITVGGKDVTKTLEFVVADGNNEITASFTKAEVFFDVQANVQGSMAGQVKVSLQGVNNGKAGEGANIRINVTSSKLIELSIAVNGKNFLKPMILRTNATYDEGLRITKNTVITVNAQSAVHVGINPSSFEHGSVKLKNAIKISGEHYYTHGQQVVVQAQAKKGYTIKAIEVKGTGENAYTNISSNPSFTAQKDSYEVKVSYEAKIVKKEIRLPEGVKHGSISFVGQKNGELLPIGTRVKLKVSPAKGYELNTLTVGGVDVSKSLEFTVGANNHIVVIFTKIPVFHKVTAKLSGNATDQLTMNLEGVQNGQAREGEKIRLVISQAKQTVELSIKINGELILEPDLLTEGRTYSKEVMISKATSIEVIVSKPVEINFDERNTPHGSVKFLEASIINDKPCYARGSRVQIKAEAYRGYFLQSIQIKAKGEAEFRDITSQPIFTAEADSYEVKVVFSKILEHFKITTDVREFEKTREPKLILEGLESDGTILEGKQLTIRIKRRKAFMYEVSINGAIVQEMTLDADWSKTITVQENIEIKVRTQNCARLIFNQSFLERDGHKIEVQGAQPYEDGVCFKRGSKVKIKVTPADGYRLKQVVRKGFNSASASGTDITNKLNNYRPTGSYNYLFFEFEKLKVSNKVSIKLPKVEHGTIEFVGYKDGDKVKKGTRIQLKVRADEGYELELLSVAGQDIKASKSFVVGTNNQIIARFKKIEDKDEPNEEPDDKDQEDTTTAIISLPKNLQHGTISFLGYNDGDRVKKGTEVQLRVTPEDGYELAELSVDGLSIKYSKSFYVSANNTIVVRFKKIIEEDTEILITLPIGVEHGVIRFVGHEDGDMLPLGTKVELKVVPDQGYELDVLTVDGLSVKYSKSFYVGRNNNIIVKFKKIKEEEKVQTTRLELPSDLEHGTIAFLNYTEGEPIELGKVVKLSVTANDGYEVESVSVGGKDITESMKFTVGKDNQIAVRFKKLTAVEELGQPTAKFYPNPAVSIIKLEGFTSFAEIRLINLSGKIVLKAQCDSMGTTSLNVAQLDRGFYILQAKGYRAKVQLK